jgi:hypothetical protein
VQVVAGGDVGEVFVEQVAMVVADPQVMVRVDDRQAGVEDRLGRVLRQPRFVGCEDAAELVRFLLLGH